MSIVVTADGKLSAGFQRIVFQRIVFPLGMASDAAVTIAQSAGLKRCPGRRGDERYVSTIMAVRGKQSGRSNVAGSLGPTPFLTPIIEPVAAVSGMA